MMPKLHPSVFTVDSAEIIGDVVIGEDSSVWYHAVIRGDVNSIHIGERTNIQDGCLLHVRNSNSPPAQQHRSAASIVRTGGGLVVGSNVTMGHGAIVHACTIGDHCLIGMGAIILDSAKINSYTLVAAGAVVLNNAEIPEGVLVAGIPANVIRKLSQQECAMIEESAQHYVDYVKLYREPS
jgi:carbonic anhydrase/acetyltransferase-like protein (isoleucine patch superfamily)